MRSSRFPQVDTPSSLADDARARESLDRLASAFDAFVDCVLVLDEQGAIDFANLAARRLLDEHDALVRRTLASIRTGIEGQVLRLPDRTLDVCAQRVSRGLFVRLAESAAGAPPTARYNFQSLLGDDDALQRAIAVAESAARVQANVLITGETGTGKEVVAQSIHGASAYAAEPFVGINCAAVPRELLEAELFGYERGAFTGARSEGSAGKLELAAQGTLLLDEIGEMPFDMQAKLLRVLQERVFMRIGGLREIPLRARVIASTHRDVDVLVREGRFRLDLVHRLRVLSITLPPLRERREDIVMLARHFLRTASRRDGKRLSELSPSVVEALRAHHWPGNVRELANVMHAEVALAAPRTTTLTGFAAGFAPVPMPAPSRAHEVVPLEQLEREAIERALETFRGNVTRASAALGLSRAALYARLRRWGVKLDEGR